MVKFEDLKKLKRFNEIAAVLAKYGFDEIIDRFELNGSVLLQKINPIKEDLGVFERIRLSIEELGPTFIKFGQIMSLRPDLLPGKLLHELEKLQDNVPAVDFNEIEKEIIACIGGPLNKHFSQFHIEPVAAASLSQVHVGVLLSNGDKVAVKVQRPGVEENVHSDLDLLKSIASFIDQQFDDLKCYDFPGLVETIRYTLLRELDFNNEVSNMSIARAHLENRKVYIPKVYEEYCSKTLLVMEYYEGKRFTEILSCSDDDRKKVAQNGLYAATKQILEDGFFHADPHPGNLLIGDGMQLCFIDWGMTGRLTEQERLSLIELLGSIVDKDVGKLTDSFLRICRKQERADGERDIERALAELLDRYHSIPIYKMNIGDFLFGILTLLRDHRLSLPIEYSIMIKALITADGTARIAYPKLNVVDEIKGQVEAISRKRYSPENIWKSVNRSFARFIAFKRDLPEKLVKIIEKIESDDIGVTFKLDKLERIINTLENASNRLTIGIVTGSIIIGSSMIITTGVKPFLFGFPALGVVGYLISVVLGLWIVVTIIRNRKY